jgi:hypothetical protein
MLAVLPYARGRGFESRSRLLFIVWTNLCFSSLNIITSAYSSRDCVLMALHLTHTYSFAPHYGSVLWHAVVVGICHDDWHYKWFLIRVCSYVILVHWNKTRIHLIITSLKNWVKLRDRTFRLQGQSWENPEHTCFQSESTHMILYRWENFETLSCVFPPLIDQSHSLYSS